MIEKQRLDLQSSLDSEKDQKDKAERNRMGQFATPTNLAKNIVKYGLSLMGEKGAVRFMEPAFGTGSFYSALISQIDKSQIEKAYGIEIDRHYGEPASQLWSEYDVDIKITDFTKFEPDELDKAVDLLICNPPYVRHQHLAKDEKVRLKKISENVFKSKVSGLSGLYCHFIAASHQWMVEGAIGGWLIPSEFMDVNYGAALKSYLCNEVTLLRIHRFEPDDSQFDDALVSSAVVWVKNEKPLENHEVNFSFGGTLEKPKLSKLIKIAELKSEGKWTRFPEKAVRTLSTEPKISDFFKIRRGLATGGNDFFILTPEKAEQENIPKQFLKPILPSPRYLKENIIHCEDDGCPKIENKLLLLDCALPPEDVEFTYPSLWRYLQKGVELGVDQAYLCKNRSFWYRQEKREASPFYCTYIGRKTKASDKPFSFILNHSSAVVSNSYLALEPLKGVSELLIKNPDIVIKIWEALNEICGELMKGEGRVYGGGMHKMEPKELANVPIPLIAQLLTEAS